MTRKQFARVLSVLALGIFLGSSLAFAEAPAAAPVPLPAFLTAPAGESCSAEGGDFLLGINARECPDCTGKPFSYCTACCGFPSACIDYPDGFSLCSC